MSATQPLPFGRYELLERLGAGGMAMVYRGKYTAGPGITKTVVIKRVLGEYADNPAFVEMFLNEARISVGLNHGNIVQVFDFGQVEGEYFLAMEFVDGQPLSRVLKQLKARGMPWMPAPLAVSTVIELCRGLHHAHTRTDEQGESLGLVHRDISPDNVLVSYEGEVKVSDFGIAKARLAGRPETEVGVVKGKYSYLAPEQLKQWPADARADVYAVGVVLFELLCGERPITGNELEIFQRATEGRHTPARSLNPGLDEDLLSILKRALMPSADERYRSAEALQQSLSDWLGSHAPRLPTHARKLFMAWCFQEQLATQHRPVSIPETFLRQLQTWRDERLLASRAIVDAESTPPSSAMHEWPVLPAELVPPSPPRVPQDAPEENPPPVPPEVLARPRWSHHWRNGIIMGGGALLGVLVLTWVMRSGEQHKQSSDVADAAYSKGRAFLELGRPADALSSFRDCVEAEPDRGACRFALANTYENLGRVKEARKEYDLYMRLGIQGPNSDHARKFMKAFPP
ncbi:protein kinase [Corallococcus exiguus]|uniref:Protein kinase n=3 Tax=Corallococcus exiguus TaxID=83462 RepID=A0A7X4YFL4_9BACT|nr:protein kinase [Corallococcus exiguus]NBC44454.1 protein kinase [Corallococcus exiguus]